MKFRVLGSSGGQLPGYNLSSFLIDDSLLIDAGSTTAALTLAAQQKIRDILVTHIHLDHVMALGTLSDNLYGKCKVPINIWSVRRVIDGLAKSFFNNKVWPDFTRITGPTQRVPVLRLRRLREGKAIKIGGYSITAIGVGHVVPTVAFLVESKNNALLHVGDTGPTNKVWSFARKHRNIGALVIEASFPNRLQDVADVAFLRVVQLSGKNQEVNGFSVTHLRLLKCRQSSTPILRKRGLEDWPKAGISGAC